MLPTIKKIQIAAFAIIISGLFYYQVINGNNFLTRAKSNFIRLIPVDAPRGLIYDTNGKPLVENKLNFNVCLFNPKEEDKTFKKISDITGIKTKVLSTNFRKNFLAPFIPTPIFITDDREKIIRLEEANIPQLIVRLTPKRRTVYPYSFAHIIGYTRGLSGKELFLKKYGYHLTEESGYSGIEKSYNSYLRGTSGGAQIEVDAYGNQIGILSEKPPRPGKNIYLTIDSQIQDSAYQALGKFQGSIILMEAETGRIIAMANKPSFNPDLFLDSKEYFRKVSQSRKKPLLNRAIQAKYPLGSVFKPVIAIAALEEESISKNTRFFCPGYFKIKDAVFKCSHVHGWQNLIEALTHSCNVFFYNLGFRLGGKKIAYYAKALGFGKLTGIDLPFEKKGLVPSPQWKQKKLRQKWYTGDTINFAIGQGYFLTTPIQVVGMMCVFANKGYLVQPYLVKQIGDIEIPLRKKELTGLKMKDIEIVNKGLRQAVEDETGTAHILEQLNLHIAGKTGTPQVKGKSAHGWFSGFFPYKKPKYVITVILEHAGSSYQACKVAYRFLNDLKEKGIITEQ